MKQTVKHLSLLNVIGLSIASISLMLFIWANPFAWSELLILVNLLTSIPFIIAGIVTLRNIENPNERRIQNTLIFVFLILWLPSMGLPLFYEFGGIIICFAILGLGLWGILKMKRPMSKMMLINALGIFFLFLNSLVIFEIIGEKL